MRARTAVVSAEIIEARYAIIARRNRSASRQRHRQLKAGLNLILVDETDLRFQETLLFTVSNRSLSN
jgi:hypothetical protein